jgi:hypothetical protein
VESTLDANTDGYYPSHSFNRVSCISRFLREQHIVFLLIGLIKNVHKGVSGQNFIKSGETWARFIFVAMAIANVVEAVNSEIVWGIQEATNRLITNSNA